MTIYQIPFFNIKKNSCLSFFKKYFPLLFAKDCQGVRVLERRVCSQPWGEQTPSDVLPASFKEKHRGTCPPSEDAMRGWAAGEILRHRPREPCFEKEHEGQMFQEGGTVSTGIPCWEACTFQLTICRDHELSKLPSLPQGWCHVSLVAASVPSCQLLKHCGSLGNGNGRVSKDSLFPINTQCLDLDLKMSPIVLCNVPHCSVVKDWIMKAVTSSVD